MMTERKILGLVTTLIFMSVLTQKVSAFQPILQPEKGNYLRYSTVDQYGNTTMYGTLNLTFFPPPFNTTLFGEEVEINATFHPELVRVKYDIEYDIIDGTDGHEGHHYELVNTTDGTFWWEGTESSDVGPSHGFGFIIPTDVYAGADLFSYSGSIEGTEVTVVNASVLTLYGNQYSVWTIRFRSLGTEGICMCEQTLGIMLWCHVVHSGPPVQEEVTYSLVEAEINGLLIVHEFSPSLILSLLMVTILFAGILRSIVDSK